VLLFEKSMVAFEKDKNAAFTKAPIETSGMSGMRKKDNIALIYCCMRSQILFIQAVMSHTPLQY